MSSIQNKIKQSLETNFSAEYVDIVNESHKHQGHAGDNGTGESHFHVTLVSNDFENKNRVARHRMIYEALDNLLECSIHALSLSLLTPEEYNSKK